MMRIRTLEHRFVLSVPRELERGVLYVSVEYATAVHSCCCGCGEQVVTPLSPTDWRMIYDGESVSLEPSIGNWQSACRSHYVITKGHVYEAERWSDVQVNVAHLKDKMAKRRFYARTDATTSEKHNAFAYGEEMGVSTKAASSSTGFWRSLARLFGKRPDS